MILKSPILSVELITAVFLLATTSSSPAATFIVSNADQIETAMETALPGDSLIMTNGNWTDEDINFAGIGAAGMPIDLPPRVKPVFKLWEAVLSGQPHSLAEA